MYSYESKRKTEFNLIADFEQMIETNFESVKNINLDPNIIEALTKIKIALCKSHIKSSIKSIRDSQAKLELIKKLTKEDLFQKVLEYVV